MEKLWLRGATMFVAVAIAAMSWFFGIWWVPLTVLAVGHLMRRVQRRMGAKRLADVRVPYYVATPLILLPVVRAFLTLMSLDGGGVVRRVPTSDDPVSPASLRAVFVICIGPPFGGFRLAFRPGFIDWPEGFVELETAVAKVVTFIVQLPPDEHCACYRVRHRGLENFLPLSVLVLASSMEPSAKTPVVQMLFYEAVFPSHGGRSANGSSFREFALDLMIGCSHSHTIS